MILEYIMLMFSELPSSLYIKPIGCMLMLLERASVVPDDGKFIDTFAV